MERLANVARSSALPIFMLMEERSARGEIKECNASQQGQRAPGGDLAQDVSHGTHASFRIQDTLQPGLLDVQFCQTVAVLKPGKSLTQQPFLPKLSLIRYMRSSSLKLPLFVLLLVVAFVGAQLHFCADLADTTSSSDACPICSATDSVAPTAPIVCSGPVVSRRMEHQPTFVLFSSTFSLVLSLRAGPLIS